MNLQTESLKRWAWVAHLFKGLDSRTKRSCALILSAMILVTPALANDYDLDFDGSNDYVSLGNSTDLKPTSALTVELWGYADDWTTSGTKALISNTQSGGYNIWLEPSQLKTYLRIGGSYQHITYDVSLLSGWHHIAQTFDGRYIKLYIDGNNIGEIDLGSSGNSIHYHSTNSTFIGAEASSGGTPDSRYYFDGEIDEVRIWNDARTQQEILSNMNVELTGSESNLVAYYKMSDGSGATLTDNSSNSNDGTLTGSDWVAATSPVSSNGDYSLNFDGSNDYVDCGNDASLKITGSSITLSAWIRAENFGTYSWINSIIDFHSNSKGYGLRCGGSGILSFNLGNGTNWYEITSSADALSTGEWYFVVGTYDGSTQRIYVNGTQVSSIARSFSIAANTTSDFYIGESDTYSGRRFDGRIDEVAVWNTPLSASAITAIYNSGTPIDASANSGNYTSAANLKGYWRFSENNGTTAYDISGNANHGTLTNGPTYSYPGADQWVTSTTNGNWNTAGTWNYGSVPTSTKYVRISHNVTMDVNATVAEIVVDANKTLTCGSYTLTATGASDINGTVTSSTGTFDANGAFDATGGAITFSGAGSLNLAGAVTSLGTMTSDNGTVTYDGAEQTVFGDAYNNLSLSGGTKTLGGNITVNGDLTNNSNAALSMSTYNVSIGGDLTIANGATWTKGSGTVTFNAASNQTLTDNNGTPQNLGTVVVD